MTAAEKHEPPATGAWQRGDPPGRRRWFTSTDSLRLEVGGRLPRYTLAYETWGRLDSTASNAVLILHALTGDSHVAGDASEGHPSPGWWDGVVGPGLAVDTGELFVVAPNALGGCQGSTGPSSLDESGRHWGSRFPRLTIRDQVAAEVALADELGIARWAAVIGGSMGGMRALEWAVTEPARVGGLLVLAAPAATSADQIAWAAPQIQAITTDADWHGGDYYTKDRGPQEGLGIARRIAHLTYRSGFELDERFGRAQQGTEDPLRGGRFAVESYLDHHAGKLARRFDAGSYVLLTRAMNVHDVGRGRSGIAEALARVSAKTVVAGIDSDRLYPVDQTRALAGGIPGARHALIESPYGHDSFLIETARVGELVSMVVG
ncbi:homoserine O-acetyltransferase [Saccharomonospora sp. NPDC006951]